MEVGGVRTEAEKNNRKELPVITFFFLVFQVEEVKRIGVNCGKFPSTEE